jgi:prolyl oligopeptidase
MMSYAGLIAAILLAAMVFTPRVAADENADMFLWLEDVAGEKALAWVKQQNKESESEFLESESFKALNRRFLKIYDSEDRIPYLSKAGPQFYNFWRDAENPRGIWRRTTLDQYRKAEPAWETVLDIDELAKREDDNWVWKGVSFLKPSYKRCLIRLSRGGADATVVREFDLESKSFVVDGFALDEAKSRVAWRNLDSLFVATDFGKGSLTKSGYPRVVKQWKRGTPLSDATLIFEGQMDDVSVNGTRDLTVGYERDMISRNVTFWTSEEFWRKNGRLIKLPKPIDAEASIWRDQIFIELRTPWRTNELTYPAGALLAAEFEEFVRQGSDFDRIFDPTPKTSLAGFTPTRKYVLVNELDNVQNRIEVLERDGGKWKRMPLQGVPTLSTVSVSAVDADESDDYFMRVSSYLTPPKLLMGTAGEVPAELLKQSPQFFNADGLEVSQHEAVSKDGTRVPYYQVARRDLELSGKNPTVLYGYGGFEISLVPRYQATTGAAWLERGGVFVVANIRGGGEFGPKWHQAALKEKRPRAYEDFIAVAENLIERRVTMHRHLGAMGGSNGGLLVGNMLTMRPDLFGAIVCRVPLLDMQRYNKLLAGASWTAEYGNPDDPKQWEFIQNFSPYHNLKKGVEYPRVLFTTSTRDDRVHPGHARKMVAKMKNMGHDVLYYENIEGGHGGAANNRQAAFMSALAYTFLWKQLK